MSAPVELPALALVAVVAWAIYDSLAAPATVAVVAAATATPVVPPPP